MNSAWPSGPARLEEANRYPQHLVWRTRERKPFLADPLIAECCLASFERERPRIRVDVYGYCLMPDHVHLIVGAGILPVGQVVQWLKLASAYWLRDSGLTRESPWARSYWDRALDTATKMRGALEYVHNNPVKAGLAEGPLDYRYSSAPAYWDRPTVLKITVPSL